MQNLLAASASRKAAKKKKKKAGKSLAENAEVAQDGADWPNRHLEEDWVVCTLVGQSVQEGTIDISLDRCFLQDKKQTNSAITVSPGMGETLNIFYGAKFWTLSGRGRKRIYLFCILHSLAWNTHIYIVDFHNWKHVFEIKKYLGNWGKINLMKLKKTWLTIVFVFISLI